MLRGSESCLMSAVSSALLLLVVFASSSAEGATTKLTSVPSAAAQSGDNGGMDGTVHNLRFVDPPSSFHRTTNIGTSLTQPLSKRASDKSWSRKVREVGRLNDLGEEDLSGPAEVSSHGKLRPLYPALSGSGELFRLFRPLAMSPEKTIGMTRWYLPGFGYFNRGGRAASSNFIRFGRSGPGLLEPEDGLDGGGDAALLSRNSAKKKNNFIRLGRENPRQTNFIRLGRSGPTAVAPLSPGEFFNSAYITPALSDPLRAPEEEAPRHGFN